MVTGPRIRDLLDTLARALPEGGPARDRAHHETLALLVAIFGPPEGESDPALEARIGRAADAILAERSALPGEGSGLSAIPPRVAGTGRSGAAGAVSRRR